MVKEKLNKENLSSARDAEQRRYNKLVIEFTEYCRVHHDITVKESDAHSYFFEVLYDIAPTLFMNINDVDGINIKRSDRNRFLVAKFVSYVDKYSKEAFESILSFVRGSMLTETLDII
uniref:Uncharacterized protein n=1 Tax=Candidatus Kentrum sp. LPFa TaxID=2126335 RepID=A0A450Y1L9_9GAMM|nr:MAG: hypothetical protein BECKLPF1236A_GA0070988_103703 [Candidatus Kentron sp. LPFa]VFK35434.1 MAG: hypothetical protein BECKLPF1236C_GA0070990_103743 [Candidatus Kentron sp. LPFa]